MFLTPFPKELGGLKGAFKTGYIFSFSTEDATFRIYVNSTTPHLNGPYLAAISPQEIPPLFQLENPVLGLIAVLLHLSLFHPSSPLHLGTRIKSQIGHEYAIKLEEPFSCIG